MTKPLVSVILAQTGPEDHLTATMESLRAQTFQDFEVVVSASNLSLASAWNKGVLESSGSFLAFIQSSQLWVPAKLEWQMQTLLAAPALHWCYCEAASSVRLPRLSGNILKPLLLQNFIPSGSVVVSRRALSEVGAFSESESFGFSIEWDMWLRLAVNPVALIPEPLVQSAPEIFPSECLFDSRKQVVEAAVHRHPDELKDLRSEALAEICVAAGNAYLLTDQRLEARDKFAEALTHSPLRSDAYLSWISSFLPSESQQQIRDLHNLGRRALGAEKYVRERLLR